MKSLREYRETFWQWLLEDRALHGLGGPPNNHRTSPKFHTRQHGGSSGHEHWLLTFNNDAFDIWISTKYVDEEKSKWVHFMAAEDFRKLALWYLWRWAWGEWFGLRRKLFYWRLRRVMKAYKGYSPKIGNKS